MEEAVINGKIKTENFENKHIADIELYDKEGNLVTNLQTDRNGNYELFVKTGTYDLYIKKRGYLDIKITDIEVQNIEQEIKIPEQTMIAGDVTGNGKINIDDLVILNENFGKNRNLRPKRRQSSRWNR